MIGKRLRNQADYVFGRTREATAPVAVLFHGERLRCLELASARAAMIVDRCAGDLVGVYDAHITREEIEQDLAAVGIMVL